MRISVDSLTVEKKTGDTIEVFVSNDIDTGYTVLGIGDASVELTIASAEELITALKVIVETRRPF